MSKAIEQILTAEQRAALDRLADLPDDRIAITADAPEIADDAVGIRGLMFRGPKQSVTIRLDEDVVAYFRRKAGPRGYQTRINEALRAQMRREIAEGGGR